jgi:uncharacterized protein YeaO (DUF488 family)
MLRTSCIYLPPSLEDGLRVSVMSRHTENDGITPDGLIIPGVSFDVHWPELAPSGRSVGRYYRREIDFDGLAVEYRKRLATDPSSASRVAELIRLAHSQDVTVLCKEDPTESHICHRTVLANYCMQIDSSLEIEIS